jgi:23S rRNA (adenine-N6)-dimethyltransferase
MPRRTARDEHRRTLGQNFLNDPRVVADVLGASRAPPGALVVDLGAGAGALTAAAAAAGHRVVAVELDPAWVRLLRSRAPSWGDVEVVQADALRVRLPTEPFHLLSNAPYGIGTQLVRRVLADAHGLVRATFVLQREAARRLAGAGRTGRFAATWAPWFALRAGRRIPAQAFRPVPSVDAAVLTIAPRDVPLLSPAAFADYSRFVERAFTGRRSTLARRLGPRGAGALAAAGVPRTATPSAVAPELYATLFTKLARRDGHPRAVRA